VKILRIEAQYTQSYKQSCKRNCKQRVHAQEYLHGSTQCRGILVIVITIGDARRGLEVAVKKKKERRKEEDLKDEKQSGFCCRQR
jgi:hypothetical protein